jgi:muramidase (phage lysozyme)
VGERGEQHLVQGVTFSFDQNSPELANFRKLAHESGIDQKTFSAALGAMQRTRSASSNSS